MGRARCAPVLQAISQRTQQEAGSSINRTSREILTLRKTPHGWKIVPSETEPPLWTQSPVLFGAVAYQMAHPRWDAQVPLRSLIAPEVLGVLEVAGYVANHPERGGSFSTRQELQRRFEGNTTAKIQSSPDSRASFLCPSAPNRIGFWFNERLLNQPKNGLVAPEKTIVAFSASQADQKLDFRLAGRALIVTADSKLHFVPPAQATEFHWNPR